jgi:hypothetical protein
MTVLRQSHGNLIISDAVPPFDARPECAQNQRRRVRVAKLPQAEISEGPTAKGFNCGRYLANGKVEEHRRVEVHFA